MSARIDRQKRRRTVRFYQRYYETATRPATGVDGSPRRTLPDHPGIRALGHVTERTNLMGWLPVCR